jgi:hypothetical protein
MNSKNISKKVIRIFFYLSLFISFNCSSDNSQSYLDLAKSNIEKEEYLKAIDKLDLINEESKFYSEAQVLKVKADSLNVIKEELMRKAKEEEEINKAFEALLKKKDQLKAEIKSIDEGVKFDIYRGSIEDLQLEIVLFGTWANIIKEGEESDDKEVKSLAKKLKSKVARIQAKEFPKLRKEYASIVANKMWENNITVKSSGTGNNKINFTGGVFASNKNIKDFQTQLYEVLRMFRFVQSRYKWYKGQDDYTYYSIEPPKDRELVDFK